ncbi:MAG: hypothetical protein EBZ49_16000 [Proteobacteria bacterium]|nr:hypothetical protein [Pseudomonadota bacterium]
MPGKYIDGRGGETRTRSPLFKNIKQIGLIDDFNLETGSFSRSVFQLFSLFICKFFTPPSGTGRQKLKECEGS